MSTLASKIVPFGSGGRIVKAACHSLSVAALGLNALEAQFAERDFAATFVRLIGVIMNVRGRVIVTGIGKSGIVARKMTATLTSTGTPAIFLHPADAGHGDLGMVTPDDVVLMLSHSGESTELGPIIQYCKRFAIPLLGMTAQAHSTVATAADICMLMPDVPEACPNSLAPTTSTTVQMAFGDAMAIALMEMRGFSADDFHKFHPNGRLGAQLIKVRELMAKGGDIPSVQEDASLLDATIEMTRARLGGTAVVDRDGRLIGAFTDGDLRRTVTGKQNLTEAVGRFMTHTPLAVGPDELAQEALHLMHERNVMLLFVCDKGKLIGAVHMHDLLNAGVA
ncbi:MAG: KpsF/GutQ family sugar-phosphate isomerase [Sphingobium sp.]|uniref:KpsF/GutQ family sugar-phosphate isomerase n=1 Tax=unclassified Sphingobium TaxID=2611147 RepID=UPI001A18A3DD|nr:KpsF/GutQ family sugar-phosphate isomerase [Sphingobium sp.]MBJ7444922.1 KpsF/GutQ family sugar-phosphate isomerase [Sphingobium sp.]MBV2147666.1 KpsF/GutQ family sugar-phosphate isomerase [Sphingobium sp. AS12]